MAFITNVTPNLGYTVLAGNCLKMAQGIFGAPVAHRSAADAADATTLRHYNRDLPDAPCVLWFDHSGAYDDGLGPYRGVPVGGVANWGHVCDYVPGVGILSSSPYAGEVSGPYRYWSIAEIENTFNCSFRFWSEDINGLRVCEPAPTPPAVLPPLLGMESEMLVFYAHALGKGQPGWLVMGYSPKALILSTQSAANEWGRRIGRETISTNYEGFRKYLRAAGGTVAQLATVSKG
ncbi:hypothetical protein MUN78_10135 [Leucobacter allii]|uniref:Uncharacterized protein n=1 Tax=Leucobacter allii TaxID=2932247 RepID=A0ABY4FHA5_9MICO|nr:hypothetical protein [Leucobacter allii]UOQ56062.1 hypothetical protein MUN78_10135 [Leucobacter allii]